jgi:hypothetical protein
MEVVKILGEEAEKPVTDAEYVPEVFDIGVLTASCSSASGQRAQRASTAAERARIINARIVHIISYAPVNPEAVRVVPVRGKPTIYVGNVRLVTVYPSDVEATGAESMQRLANIWAASTACCLRNIAPWSRIEKE